MSPGLQLPNAVVRAYLREVRRHRVAGEEQGSLFRALATLIESRWETATVGRKNLEFWLGGTAFSKEAGTLARVDSIAAFGQGLSRCLIIRGWVFALEETIAGLTLSAGGVGASSVIYPLPREDVSAAFPGEKRALHSGFMAIVPRAAETSAAVSVVLGVRLPSATAESVVPLSTSPVSDGVFPFGPCTIDSPGGCHDVTYLIVADSCHERAVRQIMEGGGRSGRVILLPEVASEPEVDEAPRLHALYSAASIAARCEARLERMVLLCDPSDDIVRLLFPTVLALSPAPRIKWIVSRKEAERLPQWLARSAVRLIRKNGDAGELEVLLEAALSTP